MLNRRALLLVVCVLLLSLSGCTKWAEKSNPSWKQATSGQHLANLFWSEVKAKNWMEVEAHLAPEFTGLGPNGITDRAGAMEHLKQMDIQDFQIGEIETRPAGNDLIVTYTFAARGTIAGNPFPPVPLRMLTVWQELKHGWVMVAHSVVPAAPK